MKVGFTGTRNGLSPEQHRALRKVFGGWLTTEFHHGDCVGADVEAAWLVHDWLFDPKALPRIVCHPPVNEGDRAFFPHCDTWLSPLNYLARNRAIVQACDLLIGCPPTKEHQPRGGTWYTIDYARKVGKRVIVIAPDGSVEDSGGAA